MSQVTPAAMLAGLIRQREADVPHSEETCIKLRMGLYPGKKRSVEPLDTTSFFVADAPTQPRPSKQSKKR
jgi:hypothetical protein